ncbi:hypothetical protein Tco_0002047 [Tanacetum coccineum]
MVYFVDGVLASGVEIILEMDFVRFVLQELEIHSFMIQIRTLSMISKRFQPPSTDPSMRPTRAANIDQSPLQEMSIQDMEDLKQHYLDEMLSLSNDLHVKDYHNEKIDIHFRRECESKIDELKSKFNGMSIEINKKKELQHLEQAAKVSSQYWKPPIFYDNDDDDDEESSIPLRDIISELPLSVAITPDLPITDSLIMGNEELRTYS